MPWRVSPADRGRGVRPDPYRIWLSEVMLQQTTVAAVSEYFIKFTTTWPTVDDLANAQDDDVMAAWAGLGYYARARNLLKCARAVVADHGGEFPKTRDGLQSLPGIGPYTSAAISAIAYDLPETVVDGNVERVMARLFDVHTPLPAAKPELTNLATTLTPQKRAGDYAQAVMDLGATICTPRSPACGICPWRDPCQSRINGTAAGLPKKTPKPQKPIRRGIAYVCKTKDGVFLERRPDKGLLGGMMGWPGSDWVEGDPTPAPPFKADWEKLSGDVRHTFTHFHLILQVYLTHTAPNDLPLIQNFNPSDLPTVMRKVWRLVDQE